MIARPQRIWDGEWGFWEEKIKERGAGLLVRCGPAEVHRKFQENIVIFKPNHGKFVQLEAGKNFHCVLAIDFDTCKNR